MKIPSARIQIKQFVESIYPDAAVEVGGYRPAPRGGKKYPYTASIWINGECIARAAERNWRLAYKTLQINFSKGIIP